MILLAAMLVLHPVLDEPGDVRMVAAGTGEEEVHWSVDGEEVGVTGDREAIRVVLEAGRHEVEARTTHDGPWEVLVRPDPRGHEGAAYVPAWTARHEPVAPALDHRSVPEWLWAVPLLVVAAGASAVPRLRRHRRRGPLASASKHP